MDKIDYIEFKCITSTGCYIKLTIEQVNILNSKGFKVKRDIGSWYNITK